MDMERHVDAEILSCNAMQIQDGTAICSIQYDRETGYWKKVAGVMPKGQAEAGFTHSNLFIFLCQMPHESRRKGTVLIVTGIPLTEKI
jgi:hypothetical protein